MRPIYLFLVTSLCLLVSRDVLAQEIIPQDQMPLVELQRYLHLRDKIWMIEKECIGDSCYTRNDSIYYWADGNFDGYTIGSTTQWGFTFQNAFYFRAYDNAPSQLEVATCSQRICVVAVNAESSQFTVHYTGETGTYQMEISALDENSFTLQGPTWGSGKTTRTYRAVTPPQAVADMIARTAKN